MDGASLLSVFSVAHVIQITAAVFFHEPSSVLIKPAKFQNNSDFGFAMGYQTEPRTLVVGAPRVDSIGKVYTCDMTDAGYLEEINCLAKISQNDFKALTNYSKTIKPDQYFYAGSTIVATDDYFFTCAPLLTMDLKKKTKGIVSDAFGTCLMYNETDTYRYQGTLERYEKRGSKISNLKSFVGGTGWSTLADKDNDLLFIVKTSLEGDFTYTKLSKPIGETTSLVLIQDKQHRQMRRYLQDYWNIGYGITAGKFFSNNTVYAFSMELRTMEGAISFLEYNKTNNVLSIMYGSQTPYKLESQEIGSMFGLAMGAADLNMDGKDELLVGAPAQSEDDCAECGALHIYIGGNAEKMDDRNRLRTISGRKELGRFASAIAANDLDGDSIPELVVSAPYEDEGLGAVYILSSYEIYHMLMKFQTFRSLQISDLKLTQRIQKETFRTLGFSLQFVADADRNGCSELLASSPGSGRVLMFKSVQTINLTVTSELIGEQIVKEQDNNFTVKVCVRVDLNQNADEIVGIASVVSNISEPADIPQPEFFINIACTKCKRVRLFCENITVILNDNEKRDYTFTSRAELYTDHIFKSKVLNASWAVASPYSQLVNSIEVHRYCSGNDCNPNLSVKTFWSGENEKKYVIGSSSNETVMIRVSNSGHESYGACVRFNVTGAPFRLANSISCVDDNGGIICYLPKPLKRNKEHFTNLVVNMTELSNLYESLLVGVTLHDNCDRRSVINGESHIKILYIFNTSDIHVQGISHSRNFTYSQITEDNNIIDDQEFLIVNNSSMTWENVYATISMKETTFIRSFKVSAVDSYKCEELTSDGFMKFKCELTLKANSTQKIIASIEMLGSEIRGNLFEDKLNTTSQLILYLTPTGKTKITSVLTVMKFEVDQGFGQNKLLIASIAILIAILILAVVVLILFKYGFFRRKQKQMLNVMKESIRRHSTKRPTNPSEGKEGTDGLPEMEVDEDNPFDEPIPITSLDNAGHK